jgi:hypothetical protein
MAEKPTSAKEYSSDQAKLPGNVPIRGNHSGRLHGRYCDCRRFGSFIADRPGKVRNIEEDFAAVVTPGLMLAFSDRKKITLSGTTIKAETATRDIWVCGPLIPSGQK